MINKPVITKTAIVTGAASGMGLALTQHLLSKPADSSPAVEWRVVLADINEEAYVQIASTLDRHRHIFVKTDVSIWQDQLALFKRAFEWSGGRIDFFASNAGIPDSQPLLSWLGRPELAEKQDPTKPDLRCLDVDLKAAFYGLQCFVHFTRKTRNQLGKTTVQTMGEIGIDGVDAAIGIATAEDFHPKMVVTASMAAQYPFYIMPEYTAAKHGCIGLVRAAAPTLLEDEGITLNAIMPSTTKTSILPKPIVEQWPEQNFTPVDTIIRAFDELIDVAGRVEMDGRSDGLDGQVKNGCCVEASTDRLFYRDPVPFPSDVQKWVGDQSKRDGILGRFMQGVIDAKRKQAE
jgi:15-hydroxyprostaglandin dehydrogenase (NAD)